MSDRMQKLIGKITIFMIVATVLYVLFIVIHPYGVFVGLVFAIIGLACCSTQLMASNGTRGTLLRFKINVFLIVFLGYQAYKIFAFQVSRGILIHRTVLPIICAISVIAGVLSLGDAIDHE